MEKTNILIADDDPVSLNVLENMLKREDLNVVAATSGREALELAENTDFAVGLIDVQMPEMSGFEAAEKIRSTTLNSELPVIFISAVNTDKEFVLQGYESGAVDYLIKPFDKFQLTSKVNIFCKIHEQKRLLEDKNTQLASVNQQLQSEISDRKTIEKRLKESETKYRKLFEKSNDALFITDKTRILDCNTAMVELFDFKSRSDLLKTHFFEFFPEKQPHGENSEDKLNGMMDMALREGSHKFESVCLRSEDETFSTEILMTAIPIGKKTVLHTVIRDITKRKESEQKLISQAIRDPLTSLFNRRYLEESLDRELSKAQRHNNPLAIIMLDADHFKMFNDTYGHLAGDKVLRDMGKHLVTYSRKEDIACRYGGEEFVLVLPETSLEVAIQRAEDLRLTIETGKKMKYKRQTLPTVTISLGVAVFPDHGNRVNALISAADKALYKAKEHGRNQVVVAKPKSNDE
jgi:diguanylate cyclase (GGDEF)-like protein/PAS domain S-box-containing protein